MDQNIVILLKSNQYQIKDLTLQKILFKLINRDIAKEGV